MNLCVFYSYRSIGKMTVFFQLQEFSLHPSHDVLQVAMRAVVVSKTSCKDRNHPILRGFIAPHRFFFFAKIMIFLDF